MLLSQSYQFVCIISIYNWFYCKMSAYLLPLCKMAKIAVFLSSRQIQVHRHYDNIMVVLKDAKNGYFQKHLYTKMYL